MKTALRVLCSLVLALIFALVLHEFSFRELPKKIVRVTGSREGQAREVRKDFVLQGARDGDLYILEARFFERRRDGLRLDLLLNEKRVVSFAADQRGKLIEFPGSFLKNGKNTLAITADSTWSFKSLRLKNLYGYSSGFPRLAVFPRENEFRDSDSPRKAHYYPIFLFLFISSAFLLNLVFGAEKASLKKGTRLVRSLRHVVPALFVLVLILPLATKYRLVLGFRSILSLAVLYFGLLYFEKIKDFAAKTARELPRLVAGWQEPLALFAVTRLGIYGVGCLSSLVVSKGPWFATSLPTRFLHLFFNWDSFWHQEIAQFGYSFIPGQTSNVAFFPLYSMLAQVSSFAVGTLRTNGFVISNLALFLAVLYLVKLVRLEFGDEATANRTAMYLLAFPGSLFFSYFYAEGLLLFLSLASFYSARRKRWLAASILGGFAALTKITGVLILIPLLLEYFEPRFEARKLRLNPIKLECLWLTLVPLGLLSFMAYCGLRFGDPLAFIHAQAVWGARPLTPAGVLEKIQMLLPFYRILYVGLILFALLMIFVMIGKRFRAGYIVFSGLLLIVYLATNALESTPRQLSVVFPLFMAMAFAGKNRLVHHLFVFFSIALLALFTILSANGYWFV